MLIVETNQAVYRLKSILVRGFEELAHFSIAYGEKMMIHAKTVHVGEGDEESGG